MPSVEMKFFDYGIKMECLASADPVLGTAIKRLGWVEHQVIPDLWVH